MIGNQQKWLHQARDVQESDLNPRVASGRHLTRFFRTSRSAAPTPCKTTKRPRKDGTAHRSLLSCPRKSRPFPPPNVLHTSTNRHNEWCPWRPAAVFKSTCASTAPGRVNGGFRVKIGHLQATRQFMQRCCRRAVLPFRIYRPRKLAKTESGGAPLYLTVKF